MGMFKTEQMKIDRGLYSLPGFELKESEITEERLPPKVSPFEHRPGLDRIRIDLEKKEGRKIDTTGDNMITDEVWEQMFTNKFEAVKPPPLDENIMTQPVDEDNFFEKLLAMNKIVVPADEASPKVA